MSRYNVSDRIENRYLVRRVLQGGLGEVYLCQDIQSDCYPIALKTYQTDQFEKDKTRRLYFALQKEAVTWTELGEHPNIVRCFYTEMVDNQIFLFLELIENNISQGASLNDLLASRGNLLVEEALKLILDVCRGLEHAARLQPGIVHRDLKPSNILVDEDGIAKITDFGLARIFNESGFTTSNAPKDTTKFHSFLTTVSARKNSLVAGTPVYMAPEQWRGLPQDHRTDIYAIGCVLYELITGMPTFRGDINELQNLHLTGSIPKLIENNELNARLNKVLELCLAKEMNERFQSITELANALSSIYRSHTGVEPRQSKFKYVTNEKDHSNLGITKSRAGYHAEALKYHNLAIEKDSTDPRFFVNRGITLENLGEIEAALADYNGAIRMYPFYARAYYHRGNLLCKAKMFEEAREDYLRTIMIEPEYALAHANLGQVLFNLKNIPAALASYGQALDLDPKLVPAYVQRGYILAKINRLAEAENDFLQARDLDPMDPLCHIHLGFFYESEKDYLQALGYFNEAVKLGHKEAKSLVEKARNDHLNSSPN